MVALVVIRRPLLSVLHLIKDHFQHGGQFVVLDFADARLRAERADIVRREFLPAQTGRVKPLPAIQGAIENVVIGVRRPGLIFTRKNRD